MESHSFRVVSAVAFCVLLPVAAVADVTASSNGPVTVGSAILLYASSTDSSATFAWNGPNNFTSTEQNPTIAASTLANAGTYTVTSNGVSAATTVTVNPQPTIYIDNVSGKTPVKGSTAPLTFHITLSAASTQTVSVEYYTSNQTAVAPRDFQYTTGEAVFQPGQTEQDVAVDLVGTNTNTQKTFIVVLYKPENGAIATLYGYPVRGRGTILAK